MKPRRSQQEDFLMDPGHFGSVGPPPDFRESFRSRLEQVRADKRNLMDQLMDCIEDEMVLERILEE